MYRRLHTRFKFEEKRFSLFRRITVFEYAIPRQEILSLPRFTFVEWKIIWREIAEFNFSRTFPNEYETKAQNISPECTHIFYTVYKV